MVYPTPCVPDVPVGDGHQPGVLGRWQGKRPYGEQVARERLEVDAPDFAARVDEQDPASVRRLVFEACQRASRFQTEDEPLADLALAQLAQGTPDDTLARKLEELAERLDDRYLDAQDASDPTWTTLFRSARLASALSYALRTRSRSTVLDSIYEAAHASPDPESFYRELLP